MDRQRHIRIIFLYPLVILVLSVYSAQCFTFTKTDSSFVQFVPDWLPTSKQGVSFRFKTKAADALLYLHYYANRTNDEPSFIFWIELRKGQLLASHLLEGHIETFSLNNRLNDDQWHSINYTKDPMEGDLSITVDAASVGLSLYQSDAVVTWQQEQDLLSAVFIGGLSPHASQEIGRDFRHLTGCVDEVYFVAGEKESWQKMNYTTQEGTEPGCVDRCATEMPCMNGQCINSYDSTYCDCIGTGFHGNKCEIEGNAVVTLEGFNFLQVTMFPSDKKMPMDYNVINLSFKVGNEQNEGVLFYAVGTLPVQTYVAIVLREGRLVLRVKLGSTDNEFIFEDQPAVNDERWHYVTFTHIGKTIEAQLDDQGYRQEVTDGDGFFHLDGQAFIGGGDNLNEFPGLDEPSNLVGCLREIYIDRFNVLEALSMDSPAVTFSGGDPIFQCQPVGYPPITFPSHESTLILDGWHNGTLDIMFDMKTAQSDGLVVLILLDVDKKLQGRLRMEIKDTALLVHMDIGTAPGQQLLRQTLRSSPGINDTRWHSVALQLQDGICTFTIDGFKSTLSYAHQLSASSSLYLGGGWRGQGMGLKGCVRHIVFQKRDVIATRVVNTAAAEGVVLDNCPMSNPCAAGEFVCQHGGTCSHVSGGARCNCDGTGYVGAMCSFATYKTSCSEHYHSGDKVSGVKMLDLDGPGPLNATYVNCSFSSDKTQTAVEHNFAAKTLVRDVNLPSVQFSLEYRHMTAPQLKQLVRNSQRCRQYFSYWCFEAPLYVNKGWTAFQSAAGRHLRQYNLPFAATCNLNDEEWNVDRGFITNKGSLPIVNMQFYKIPSVSRGGDTTKGMLSLGLLECSSTLTEQRGSTVTITRSRDYITLDTWTSPSLYFRFRTSAENIVLFHQMSDGSDRPLSLTAVVKDAYSLDMTLQMNDEFYDVHVTSKRPMTDGQWHTLTVERSFIDLHVAVDFSEGFLNLPKGVMLEEFTGPFMLGGMKELPKGTSGLTGCIADFTFNGGIVFLYDYYEHEETLDIKTGCSTVCDSSPCQNGGSCVDHWTKYSCNCAHPAHTGHDCSIDNTKDVVSFTIKENFLEYEPRNDDILTSDLQLGFRTLQSEALILYARDNFNNFLQMEMLDGSSFVVTFNSGNDIHEVALNSSEGMCPPPMDDHSVMCSQLCQDDSQCSSNMKCCSTGCGTDCLVPQTGYVLNSGEWIDVAIERKDDSTVLIVNQRKAEVGAPVNLLDVQPGHHVRSKKSNGLIVQTFIGGTPDSISSSSGPGLMGCVRGLIVNGQSWKLEELARTMQKLFTSKAPSLQCENHCSNDSCKNGGVCEELWTGFRCNCSGTTQTGKTCEQEYGAQFQEDSMLEIPVTSSNLDQDHLEFGFSTDHPSGVLFYVRNDASSDVVEKLMIVLVDGDLEAHVDLGAGLTVLRLLGPFNDTFRHSVVFRRFGSRVLFSVDNIGDDYETLESTEETEFNERAVMVIGGMETNMTSLELEELQGFKGCLTGLTYNGLHPLETLFISKPEADSSTAVHRQQCPGFQPKTKEKAMMNTTTLVPNGQKGIDTVDVWTAQPAEYVTVDLPPDLAKSSNINWIVIGAVSGACVAVLVILICFCCILKASKKEEDSAQPEERQRLVKPQEEIHIVHPVREEAAEAQCLEAPPPPPEEPADNLQTDYAPAQQQPLPAASLEGLNVPGGNNLSCDEPLSDDAAFTQLELEAGGADEDEMQSIQPEDHHASPEHLPAKPEPDTQQLGSKTPQVAQQPEVVNPARPDSQEKTISTGPDPSAKSLGETSV